MIDYDEAKKRANAVVAKTRAESGAAAAEVAARVMQGTLEVIAAKPSDKPPASIRDAVAAYVSVDSRAESIESQYFESVTGRKYRSLRRLYGADRVIRSIPKRILRDFSVGVDAAPDEIVAISSTRPGEYWKIHSLDDLHLVMDLLSLDIGCDLDLFKNTDVDSCAKANTKFFEGLKRLDKGCTSRDGLPNPHQREHIPQYFATVPFAYGNVIILSRICTSCFGAWIYRNIIDTKRIGEVESVDDGFGSVGGGPIPRSEAVWDKTVVAQVARDWELRNGRPPSVIELQKALQGVSFVGEGVPEAQKITDK